MTQEKTAMPVLAPETVTVQALVRLTVTPKEGQTPEEASVDMLTLFTEYVTERESPFLTDYGATPEALQRYRASKNDPAEQPAWGGWEGPFVLDSRVEAVA